MPLQIVRADITSVEIDAIVNSANITPIPEPRGTDGKIHQEAGREQLFLARKEKIGAMKFGGADFTESFNLGQKINAKIIIHTVAPIWKKDDSPKALLEKEQYLRDCYRNSLSIAVSQNCQSVSFPLLATGINGVPIDFALNVAIGEMLSFLFEYPNLIIMLVLFDKETFDTFKRIFPDWKVNEHVKDYEVYDMLDEEYDGDLDELRRKQTAKDTIAMSFREYLSRLIGEKICVAAAQGKKLSTRNIFLIKANLSERVYASYMKRKSYYTPRKNTAICLALALELSLQKATELLNKAGFSFSKNDPFDVLIADCIRNGTYDIEQVNNLLTERNFHTLGYRERE